MEDVGASTGLGRRPFRDPSIRAGDGHGVKAEKWFAGGFASPQDLPRRVGRQARGMKESRCTPHVAEL